MNKLLSIILVILVSGSISAQKIKINGKTGIVSIDNVNVAYLNASKSINDEYTFVFKNINSDDSVTIDIIKADKPENNFLSISSNLSDKTSEMDYQMINFTLNINSVIANLIINKYNFFDADGMSKNSIIDYLSREDHTRQNTLNQRKEKSIVQRAKIVSYSPIIKKKMVVNNITNDTLAFFVNAKGVTRGNLIKDKHGNDLATLIIDEVDRNPIYILNTFHNRSFSLKKTDNTDIRMIAIDTLIVNDYMGNDPNSYPIRKPIFDQEMIALDKKKALDAIEDNKRSKVDGVLILTNGDTISGTFDFRFRQTPQGILSTAYVNNTLVDPAPENKYIDLYGDNNQIAKKYNDNNITSFKVINFENDDSVEVYIRLTYTQEPVPPKRAPILSSDGTIDLFGAGKSFIDAQLWGVSKKDIAYVAFNSDSTSLYFIYQKIFIADKRNDRTILLNPENFETQLLIIANGCEQITRNIKRGRYLYTQQSMLDFAHAVEDCKKDIYKRKIENTLPTSKIEEKATLNKEKNVIPAKEVEKEKATSTNEEKENPTKKEKETPVKKKKKRIIWEFP